MKDIIADKRKEVSGLLGEHIGERPYLTLAKLVLESLPNRFWKKFDAREILFTVQDYISFICEGSPFVEKKGQKTPKPKVRIRNIGVEEQPIYSLKRDATLIEIHTVNLPFVYESIRAYFTKKGQRLIAASFTVFSLRRKNDSVTEVIRTDKEEELFIGLYVEKITDTERLVNIEKDLIAILNCLALSVGDFEEMKARLRNLASKKAALKVGDTEFELSEISDFLNWMAEDNFVFIGIREYRVDTLGGKPALSLLKKRNLGLFRDDKLHETIIPGLLPEIESIIAAGYNIPRVLTTDFCNNGSRIIYQLPPVQFYSIRTKCDTAGLFTETVITGRLTRGAIHGRSDAIPVFRRKSLAVINELGRRGPQSFAYREARALLNYMPKEEIFYAGGKELTDTVSNIMSIQSDDEVSIHIREGGSGRYVRVMVTISRNDNSIGVRKGIEDYLTGLLGCPLTSRYYSSTESRTLLFYYFETGGLKFERPDILRMEEEIGKIAVGWDQRFYLTLYDVYAGKAAEIYTGYIKSFDNVYKNTFSPSEAVSDVEKIELLSDEEKIQIDLVLQESGTAILKFYSLDQLPLMRMLKTLVNFGLYVSSEQEFFLKGIKGGNITHIYNYAIEDTPERIEKIIRSLGKLRDAFIAVEKGKAEEDNLNRLLFLEELDWRSIELVRTMKHYLLQINRTYNAASVIDIIVKYSPTVKKIIEFFEAKFESSSLSKKEISDRLAGIGGEIEEALSFVHNLGDFQVLNTLFEIVKCTTRTNFFLLPQRNCISLKIEGACLSSLPSPRPFAEIYIHSPTFEGVHLRGGMVARGGIRWSDRIDDFRTEILGLMKTQMLKNSIIVPVGAKGGFVIKKEDFPDREARLEFMKEQYGAFIRGMIELTDNYEKGKGATPAGLVIYDTFDPYLVVAADKGTAALSDRANEIAKECRFWLDDAFASGSTTGYDHKEIGITARGVWECAKRHFRELGTDIRSESISVVGIGDMSGDVFGNGMLHSDKIRLIGAFNHLHIFLDPDPDPRRSYQERERLFHMPGSSWADYNPDLISEGGGVYSRAAKSVPLSDEIKKYLNTSRSEVSGEEMIRLLLTADVDLLYNGGVGTYIKASTESHLDAGDKANDSVRVDAKRVRAKVIGEGGNLGITQKGRIEYTEKGGRCNTDAVDNSGGVNISDYEVNLKILLSHLTERGEIESRSARDELLHDIKDQVTQKVLRNNYLQSAAISMDFFRASEEPEKFMTVVDEMEKTLGLDREEECIPPAQDMADRIEKGKTVFTRPMLADLMARQKMNYYVEVLDSPLVTRFFSQRYLKNYFPDKILREFEPFIEEHRLKNEIISTVITNKIINQAGITLFPLMALDTGRPVWQIAKAYLIIENLLHADSFREEVLSLDNRIPSKLQYLYLRGMEDTIVHALHWFLTHQTEDRITFDFVHHYSKILAAFKEGLWEWLEKTCSAKKFSELNRDLRAQMSKGVPENVAATFVSLQYLRDVMDIIRIKEEHHYNFMETAGLYIKVGDYFDINRLAGMLSSLKPSDKWSRENIAALRHELLDCQNGIVASVLNFKRKSEDLIEAFEHYIQEKTEQVGEYRSRIDELETEGKADIVSLNVVIKRLAGFVMTEEGMHLH